MSNNIRFWDYINSPVKLTLKPGQTLHHTKQYFNGEGYSIDCISWSFNYDKLKCIVFSDGFDCDGRLRTYQEYESPITEIDLYSYFNKNTNMWTPSWTRIERDLEN